MLEAFWGWRQSRQCGMSIPISVPLDASNSVTENMMLKRVRAKTHLCLTPFVTGKAAELSSLSCTLACMPSWNCLTMVMIFWTVFWHDSPKAVSADRVKYLDQINISRVEVSVLFLILLLKLSCSKHHVNSPTFLTEAALTLRWESLFEMLVVAIQ